MAFMEFYVQSGGSNLNAGSVAADAATVTVVNANWNATTRVYTGLTGVEFAGVSVGEWASVYLDAATVTPYVAEVTAVGALGVSITLSATLKQGTAPTTGATGRSCKVGGAHASITPWGSTGFAAVAPGESTRVNIKNATYTRTADDIISMPIATGIPVWFRGYTTTIGDCDEDPTLARPIFAYNATFQMNFNGTGQSWSSLEFTGNRSGFVVAATSNNITMVRLRAENTSTNAAAGAFLMGVLSGYNRMAYCWGKTPTSGTTNGVYTNNAVSATHLYVGCVAEGGGNAGFLAAGCAHLNYFQCLGLNNTGNGFKVTGASVGWRFINNTVYNSTSDGIYFDTIPTETSCLLGNALWVCGGYGVNNAGASVTSRVLRLCNSFYLCTSGNYNQFGDMPEWFPQAETSQPYTSATDMTPVIGSLSRAAGFAPGNFENQSFRSAADIGAVQFPEEGGWWGT
jgi:hypothetical protein